MAKRTNYFLPYLRQGITTLADHKKTGERPTLPVKLGIRAMDQKTDTDYGKADVNQTIVLFGPGDILGINQRVISRIAPPLNTTNFESSLTPFIEFSDPDFLWRFSSKQLTNKNWIPWLALIVLKVKDREEEAEFEKVKNHNKELPPQIRLSSNAILPDLKQSWRFAHVHYLDLENKSLEQVQKALTRSSKNAVCRLLSPRKLKPQTKYHAFLVPAFRVGADAALGQLNQNPDEKIDRNLLTWKTPKEGKGMTLPYYFDWQFSTGTKGDFEFLVRKLKPRELENLGTRTIDCSNPGYGMVEEAGLELEMEAALKSMDTGYQEWGMDTEDPKLPLSKLSKKKQTALANILNKREEEVEDENGQLVTKLRVTPPVYGEWYLNQDGKKIKINPKKRTQWINELNLDFRHRAAAGLGVQFVKENQEGLMKAAWEQMSKIKQVNRQLNLGRFGRTVSTFMFKRLEKMEDSNLLNTVLPMQYKILEQTQSRDLTVKRKTIGSVLSNKFSKNQSNLKVKKFISRSKKKRKGRRAKDETASSSSRLVFRPVFESRIVDKVFKPQGTSLLQIGTPPIFITNEAPQIVDQTFVNFGKEVKQAINPIKTIEDKFEKRFRLFRKVEKRSGQLNDDFQTLSFGEDEEDRLRPVLWHPEFHRPVYRFLRDLSQEYILPGLEKVPQNTIGLLLANTRFIESFMMGMNHEFASELRWREFPTDMRGNYFRSFWDTTIYSLDANEKKQFWKTNVGNTLKEKLSKKYGGKYKNETEIEKTYTNGEPTETEIEIADAYEVAVEKWLLTREEDKDIDRPSNWLRNTPLGSNPNPHQTKILAQNNLSNQPIGTPTDDSENEQVVLLVKGELLQKFDNTLIYLVEKKNKKPNLELNARRVFPVFEGALPPDVVFIGFPIKKKDVKKYFVIFEERMTDLRFGLDVAKPDKPLEEMTENDMSWEHFTTVAEDGYLNGKSPEIFKDEWKSAAFVGKVMVQKQVRVAVKLEEIIPD